MMVRENVSISGMEVVAKVKAKESELEGYLIGMGLSRANGEKNDENGGGLLYAVSGDPVNNHIYVERDGDDLLIGTDRQSDLGYLSSVYRMLQSTGKEVKFLKGEEFLEYFRNSFLFK